MPGDYSCILCSKNISYAGKKKHLFSKRHLTQIHSGILRARVTLERWIAEYDQGKRNHLRDCFPPIRIGINTLYTVCIPCNHMGEMVKGHTCTQEAMKQNVEYYKNILNQPIHEETRVSIETQTNGSEGSLGVVLDTKEIDKLKKEIKSLEQDNLDLIEQSQATDERCKKSETIFKALTYVLEFMKEENDETYQTIMDNLKDKEFGSIMEYITLSNP